MIKAKLYMRPDGKVQYIDVQNISPHDEEYLKENNVQLSMEDLNNTTLGYAVYLSDGTTDEHGDVKEITEISKNRSCRETISSAVVMFKKMKERVNARK